MSELTAEELFDALVESAGEIESPIDPTADLDLPFEEIGYDSLALMEATAKIKKRTGVAVEDQQITDVETPRQLLDLFNQSVPGKA
jgi:act minimal PKS acyl carrier protein